MSSIPSMPGHAGTPYGALALPMQLARWFGSLFEIREPAERTRALTFIVLSAIVIVGAVLRFWGLGAIGLHGDEETMAMPTMHIVQDGQPLLPSGMFYPRGIAQLYMMAGAVKAFGESEWAFRLPSALCGILLVVLAFYAGRRFLTPTWNLAFTAAVALLPEFIVDAQTARMYGFLVACVTGYMILLFRWERTDNAWYLAGAVVTLIIGIQFQTLAVFAAFMAFYPGLVRGELHKIVFGAAAFAAIVAGFMAIDHWIVISYPAARNGAADDEGVGSPGAASAIPQVALWVFAVAAVGAAALSAFAVRLVRERVAAIAAAALMAMGLLAQVAFSYHLAALLIVAGAVVAMRAGQLTVARVLPLAIVCVGLMAGQFYLLHERGVTSAHQILGAMLGWPSIWPQIVVSHYSVIAGLLAGLGLVGGLWCLARRKPVPDFVLLIVLGLWIPLIAIGLFRWNVALRYTSVQTIPLLLGAFAAAQWVLRSRGAPATGWQAIFATVACVLVVNPIAFARTVHSGYATNPDHQGAATFIQSVNPGPRDIVIAEDVLEQTYYLGHVDYWLQARSVAAPFILNMDGVWKDFYTNTPLIGSAEELQRLIDKPDRGAIYIIGSGENQEDGRRYVRGEGLANMLESPRFKVIFRGRDDLTKVLKLPAPGTED
ncbi:MAG: glycosyltransferase family 39 protein [Gammaproteobacteria bacterium]